MPPVFNSVESEVGVGEEEEGAVGGAGASEGCVGEGFIGLPPSFDKSRRWASRLESIGLLPPAEGGADEGALSEFDDMSKN